MLTCIQKPVGILPFLHEESNFPRSTDLTFTQKSSAQLAQHASRGFTAPKADRDLHFFVSHYAGTIKYNVSPPLPTCSYALLSFSFLAHYVCRQAGFWRRIGTRCRMTSSMCLHTASTHCSRASSKTTRVCPNCPRGVAYPHHVGVTDVRKNKATVAQLFAKNLGDLVAQLSLCQPHFVRCLKPNESKVYFQSRVVVVPCV